MSLSGERSAWMHQAVAVIVAVLAIVTLSGVARAAPRRPGRDEDSTASAYREHIQNAAAAARRKNWPAAAAEYAAARALSPTPQALAGLAEASYQSGRWADAYDLYQELLRTSELPPATRAALVARVNEIDEQTGRIAFSVTTPDAKVLLDEREVGFGPVNQNLRVEVGRHVVQATKAGYVTVERVLQVQPHRTANADPIELKPVEKVPEPTAEPTKPRDAPTTPPQPAPPEQAIVPHGARSYRPIRLRTKAPKIDGDLSDAVWTEAPKETRFFSVRSLPYGKVTSEPTTVQLAFDEDALYVAVRCTYSAPGPRDDAVVSEEERLLSGSEFFEVDVDGRHDHQASRAFFVNRAGDRADVDRTNNGETENYEWRGIWDVATVAAPNGWTAEFALPWAALNVNPKAGEFDIGINFGRNIPLSGEEAWWIPPPVEQFNPPSKFGHLVGLTGINHPPILFFQPYIAAFAQSVLEPTPRLRDFFGTAGHVGVYSGFYARLTPVDDVRVDVTANPDFSQATPDRAFTNLTRFELLRPEVRPFFADDLNEFAFGLTQGGPLLFYSRRVGLQFDPTTNRNVNIPILYGTKTVANLWSGGGLAAMLVGTGGATGLSLDDTTAVVRYRQQVDNVRFGNMFLFRSGREGTYFANGVDASASFIDQKLRVSAFGATSSSASADDPSRATAAGLMGGAGMVWGSLDYNVSARVIEVGSTFDPRLGYVEQTGIRQVSVEGSYHPRLNTEFIRKVFVTFGGDQARRSSDDDLFSERISLLSGMELIDQAILTVRVDPSLDNVTVPFSRAGGRILVTPGRYPALNLNVAYTSPPGKAVEFSLYYIEGELYGGYQRRPGGSIGLNAGRLSSSVGGEYTAFRTPQGVAVDGFFLSSRSSFRYTTRARTSLAIEANTFDPTSTIQLVTSYAFGLRSSVALVLQQSAANIETSVNSQADRRAIASFSFGMNPF